MSFTFLNELPSPAQIQERYPLSEKLQELKKQRDAEISNVIKGLDNRFLVIIGPCSADNEDSVCDYVSRLTSIQEDVKDKLIIIPRVYTNKPRTTGEGYKGIASQPDPEKAPDMVEGLIAMRKMHIRAIEESGLTCADEMLYPENWGYVEDLLSYVAIGARSVEDQQHRLTVSGFDVASGMKNPTSGDFSVMLNSVYAAQHPHHFVYRGYEVETTGNPLTHVVLRGAVSKHGNTTQNYHYEDLIRLHEMYEKMDVIHPAAIIDTNPKLSFPIRYSIICSAVAFASSIPVSLSYSRSSAEPFPKTSARKRFSEEPDTLKLYVPSFFRSILKSLFSVSPLFFKTVRISASSALTALFFSFVLE